MMHHKLKCDGPKFRATLLGQTPYEIRFNDRNYQVGDRITLRETLHTGEEMKEGRNGLPGKPLIYTGWEQDRTVTHVLDTYGLQKGWAILTTEAVLPIAESVRFVPGADLDAKLGAMLGGFFKDISDILRGKKL